MLEAGGGFRFATESLKMCFRSPVTEANDFERHGAAETFLSRAINDALTAAANFLQQFIVTKIGQRLCRTRNLFNLGRSIRTTRSDIFNGGAVIASGYSLFREQTKACLKQANCAKSFGRVGEDFRSALSTNSQYA